MISWDEKNLSVLSLSLTIWLRSCNDSEASFIVVDIVSKPALTCFIEAIISVKGFVVCCISLLTATIESKTESIASLTYDIFSWFPDIYLFALLINPSYHD